MANIGLEDAVEQVPRSLKAHLEFETDANFEPSYAAADGGADDPLINELNASLASDVPEGCDTSQSGIDFNEPLDAGFKRSLAAKRAERNP